MKMRRRRRAMTPGYKDPDTMEAKAEWAGQRVCERMSASSASPGCTAELLRLMEQPPPPSRGHKNHPRKVTGSNLSPSTHRSLPLGCGYLA